MPNYRIVVEYDGTDFSGWQLQPERRTVQGELEKALRKLNKGRFVRVHGAGRTDAGVHARGQVANFLLPREWRLDELANGINGNLDDDVWVKSCELAPDEFHSRFSATSRTYGYYCKSRKSVMDRRFAWNVPFHFSVNRLRQCARFIGGDVDFTSFCKFSAGQENRRCIVNQCKWIKRGDFVIFRVEANRFLQHLVRYLVGTMMEVARGGLEVGDFRDLLDAKNPRARIWKAPACGLFLEEVSYS